MTTLEIFAQELIGLWEPGIVVDGVALINEIFDGKGLESVTKTQGSCSLEGCNACQFGGIRFGDSRYGSVVYPFYSSYLPLNDPKRLKRPNGRCREFKAII